MHWRGCLTSRARGRYCSSVQGHDATTSMAQNLQTSRPERQLDTIWACAEQWKVSWGVFQALRGRRSLRMSSRHCQCDSVVWVCGQQGGWHLQLSGLLGPTHSPCSPLACQELTNRIVEDLSNHPQGCLAQLKDATRVLDRSGFVGRPEWHELRAGRRPPEPISSEPGEWKHAWLAIPRILLSRIPFQGDRGVGPVMSRGASSSQVPLGSRVQRSSPWCSHWSGVQTGTLTLPSTNPGESEIVPRRHSVQM